MTTKPLDPFGTGPVGHVGGTTTEVNHNHDLAYSAIDHKHREFDYSIKINDGNTLALNQLAEYGDESVSLRPNHQLTASYTLILPPDVGQPGDLLKVISNSNNDLILDWSNVSYVEHTHIKADIQDFDEADYAPASHSHFKSDIINFDDADYAPAIHNHDADYLKLSGGSLSGALGVSQTVNINAPTGNASLTLELDGTDSAALFALTNYNILRRYNSAGNTSNELKMYDTYSIFSQPLRITDDLRGDTATSRGYVADNFLSLAGDTLTGNLIIDHNNYPTFTLNADAGEYGNIFFQQDGVTSSHINGRPSELRLTRAHSASGTDTTLKMFDDVIEVNKQITGVAPTAATHLTTKDYVDDNFMKLTGDQTITDTNDLYFSLDAGGNPILLFKHDGDPTGRIYANSSSFNITHYGDNNNQSNIKMYPTYTLADKPILSGSAQGDNAAALTRKDYVDDNFVSLSNTEVIGGLKEFSSDITINKPSGNSLLWFEVDGVRQGLVGPVSGSMRIRQYDGTTQTNEMVMYNSNTSFTNDVRCTAMAQTLTHLQQKRMLMRLWVLVVLVVVSPIMVL